MKMAQQKQPAFLFTNLGNLQHLQPALRPPEPRDSSARRLPSLPRLDLRRSGVFWCVSYRAPALHGLYLHRGPLLLLLPLSMLLERVVCRRASMRQRFRQLPALRKATRDRPQRPERVRHLRTLQENGLFLSFPYVCPEPVLVK